MGHALVAFIDRARRRIELDPAVRVGTRLNFDREAVLLHTTSLGHCGETAADLARVLRQSGWRVTVRDVDGLAPLVASVGAFVDEIGPAPGYQPEPPPEPTPEPTPKGRDLRSKTVCLVCGHATVGGRHVESHRRNRGHDRFQKVPADEVAALQARLRLTWALASAPEGQEAPLEAPDQRANGYTRLSSPEALE